ncbi:hypothetical protein [Sediminicola luteus]|uniref:Uncharacterized protein n=1 Tax=Sediminicola luteus TaxID=319238 RepID=A0A2A4G8W3_9FLAO|nr:hypothetical protein [Sediminicola luteus]PCE64410.1 hypothetical protein B7P33_08960 [Sediminicola luteus]
MRTLIILVFLVCFSAPQWAQQRAQGMAISYELPQGWKVMQEEYGTLLLGHETIPGFILLQEHGYNGQDMVVAEMAEGVQEEGILLSPTHGIRQLDNGDYFAEYQGQVQGQAAKAVAVTSMSKLWQIGGVMVMTMVNRDLFTPQHQELAIRIAQSIQYHPFMDAQAQQWAQLVKGRMLVYLDSYSSSTTLSGSDGDYAGENSVSMSTREEVHLCSNGQFAIQNDSSSSLSMSGPMGMGNTDRDQSQNQGLWALMNINNTPVFRLLYTDGSVEYHAVEDYREDKIYIGGKAYTIAAGNRCQ